VNVKNTENKTLHALCREYQFVLVSAKERRLGLSFSSDFLLTGYFCVHVASAFCVT
jgi:hypothetical protein